MGLSTCKRRWFPVPLPSSMPEKPATKGAAKMVLFLVSHLFSFLHIYIYICVCACIAVLKLFARAFPAHGYHVMFASSVLPWTGLVFYILYICTHPLIFWWWINCTYAGIRNCLAEQLMKKLFSVLLICISTISSHQEDISSRFRLLNCLTLKVTIGPVSWRDSWGRSIKSLWS